MSHDVELGAMPDPSHPGAAAGPENNATNAAEAPRTSSHTHTPKSGFSDGSGALLSIYLRRAEDEDKKTTDSWKGNADGILIFTGLFSATVAAFLAVSIQLLQLNPQDTTAFYMAHLYNITAAGSSTAPVLPFPSTLSDPSQFKPSSSAIWVNVLWFLSLIISLTCALLATLLQQWARRYLRVTRTHDSLEKRARIRAYFAEGVEKLYLPTVVEALPGLLHVSVYLFFAGLPIFLFGINRPVFIAVLSCVSICGALYLFIAFIPLFCHDSPYYTPLSKLFWSCYAGSVWFFPWVYQSIISRRPICDFINARTRNNLADQVKEHYERLQGGLIKCMEASALTSFGDFDVRVLLWTFNHTDEEDELDQLLAAIPGFFNSSSVTNTQKVLDAVTPGRLSNAVLQLMDRSLSSDLVNEPVRQQRSNTCMKVLEIGRVPKATTLEESLRFIGTGVFKWTDLGLLATSVDGVEAQCVTALITAQTRGSDHRWSQAMERQLSVSTAALERYVQGGDSLLLANLIKFVQRLEGHQLLPGQMKPVDDTLTSLSKFDATNTLPGLQVHFCQLWDTTLSAARQNLGTYIGRQALSTLRRIIGVYSALHSGTDVPSVAHQTIGDDVRQDGDEAQSYPFCTCNRVDPSAAHPPTANTTLNIPATTSTQSLTSLSHSSPPLQPVSPTSTSPTTSNPPPVPANVIPIPLHVASPLAQELSTNAGVTTVRDTPPPPIGTSRIEADSQPRLSAPPSANDGRHSVTSIVPSSSTPL